MKPNRSLILFLASSAVLAGANTAHAQKTWTGASSVNWTATNNWSPTGAPGSGADVIFDGTGINLNTTFNGTARTLNSLAFTSGQTSAVTINTTNAAALSLGPTSGTGPFTVLNSDAGSHRFVGSNDGITYDFRFNGTTGTNFVLDVDGSSTFEIAARIGLNNGGTASNRNFEKTGTGKLILSGNNGSGGAWNFSAGSSGFTVSDGILQLAASAASGNSANNFAVSPGSGKQSAIEISGGTTHTFNNGTITLNGTGISSNGALRSLSGNNSISGTGTGGISLASSTSIGVDADALSIGVVVSNSGNLTKVGAGTLTLTGTNTYTGATVVSEGTLAVTGSGSINSSSDITVGSGAQFKYNSSTALTKPITNNGGTISGTGTISVNLGLNSTSDVISPGNSPGIQPYGVGQTWSSMSYLWETNNFTGTTAGTDFDQITITGNLSLTGAAAGSYILDLVSLTAGNTAGNVPNFSEINRSWNILTTTGTISGFNASYWTIDTAGPTSFTSSPAWGGTWSIGLNSTNNALVLNYTAIPEPATTLLGGLGLLALLRRRRCREH